MDVDTALTKVGGYKRWHLAMFFFLGITGFMPLCWQGLSIVFLGISPDHHCQISEGGDINGSIPWLLDKKENEKWHLDECHVYVNSSLDNSTMECPNGWTYYKEEHENSIVTEWDLVCKKDYYSDLSQTIYQVGALIGELLCSVLVDKFGRRKTYLVGTLIIIVLGTTAAFSPNYIFFCIVRTIMAAAVLGQCWAAETMMMEIFDSKRRAFAGIGLEAPWVIDYVLLAGLAYLLRNWRHLQLVISLLLLPALTAIWFLPESPMWLVANGKVEESEKVLQDMARNNGVKVPQRLLPPTDKQMPEASMLMEENHNKRTTDHQVEDRVKDMVTNPPVYPFTALFTDPTMRKLIIISSSLWFANSVLYYGLILATPSMPGDVYLNFLLGAIVEIPAYIITYPIVVRFGRRVPTVIFHTIAGISLGALIFIPTKTASGTDLSVLISAMALFGKFAITIAFAIVILYTKEIFPTNLRSTSGGFSSVPARIGTMCAPFASYVSKHIPWLIHTIMAILSLAAAAITLLLPETKKHALPHTIEQVKEMYIGHKTLSCRTVQNEEDEEADLSQSDNTNAKINGVKHIAI